MTRRHARLIVALVTLISAVAHGWVIAHAVAPAQDAIRFAHQARRLRKEPWLRVVRSEAQHPLYPMLAAVVAEGLERWRPGPSLANHVLALQLTAAVFGVALVPVSYLLARQVVCRAAALWGTLLFNLSPRIVEVSSDGLSDSLHLFLVALAALLVCRALRSRRALRAWLTAGLVAGAAFWVRPEGVLVCASAALVVLVRLVHGASDRARLLGGYAVALVAVVVVLGMFVAATGRLTTKATANKLFGLSLAGTHESVDRPIPPFSGSLKRSASGAEPARQAVVTPARLRQLVRDRGREPEATGHNPAPARKSWWAAWREYCSEMGSAYQYVPLLFAAVGVLHFGRLRPNWPAALYLGTVFGLYTLLVLMLYTRVGYLSMRHVLVPAVMLLPTIGLGAWASVEHLVRYAQAASDRIAQLRLRRAVTAVFVIGAAALFMPRLAQPLHHSRRGAMEAAEWLSGYASGGDVILDIHLLTGAYANLPTYPLAKHRLALRDPRLRFVVIDVDDLRRRDPPYSTLLRILRRRARLVAVFPTEPASEPSVLVYEMRRPLRTARQLPR